MSILIFFIRNWTYFNYLHSDKLYTYVQQKYYKENRKHY